MLWVKEYCNLSGRKYFPVKVNTFPVPKINQKFMHSNNALQYYVKRVKSEANYIIFPSDCEERTFYPEN